LSILEAKSKLEAGKKPQEAQEKAFLAYVFVFLVGFFV